MARQLEIPLPEITKEDFKRSWARFDLVAKAKEWDEDRKRAIIPTLLRGKLFDAYVELPDESKEDLQKLKEALAERAGTIRDPLSAAKLLAERNQRREEKVIEYADELKELFRDAYPSEKVDSAVLVQRFLTGLLPEVARQVLLKGRPKTMEEAVKMATDAQYALQFGGVPSDQQWEVCPVLDRKKPTETNNEALTQLQQAVEQLTKRFDALESQDRTSHSQGRPQRRRRRDLSTVRCYKCNEMGHFQYHCHLNEQLPASREGGCWQNPQ